MTEDALGDRMKSHEAVETKRRLDPSLPIYARIDGRGFSKFTAGMQRPFDPQMTQAMIETTRYLVQHTHARIGYVQSDEISLVWRSAGEEQSVFFDGKVMKMASVLAGMATAAFNRTIRGWAPYEDRFPAFDARVLQLPEDYEAANMFLWRSLDATKNAVSMAARHYYSSKELHGKRRDDMLEMMRAKGVDFERFDPAFRHGTFVQRVTRERVLSPEELSRIPERNRPAGPVMRSEVVAFPVEDFRNACNRTEFILDGEPLRWTEE